jgi:hypothetical protein
MKAKILKLLYALPVAALLLHQQVYGIIITVNIMRHPQNEPIVLLGDKHDPDIRSYTQQYDIIELASSGSTRLICEDSGFEGEQKVLGGLTRWASLAGCVQVNVEFRMGDNLMGRDLARFSAKNWATKCLNTINSIKLFDDEYNDIYQNHLQNFNFAEEFIKKISTYNDTPAHEAIVCTILTDKKMSLDIFGIDIDTINSCDICYDIKTIMSFYDILGLNKALDLVALHQIALSNKNKEIPIVAAGAWHTRNLLNILQTRGYTAESYGEEELSRWMSSLNSEDPTDVTGHIFNPIPIPKLPFKNSLGTLHTPPLRSKILLPYLQVRGALEDSAFGRWKYRNRAFLNTFGVRQGLKLAVAGFSAIGLLLASKSWSNE